MRGEGGRGNLVQQGLLTFSFGSKVPDGACKSGKLNIPSAPPIRLLVRGGGENSDKLFFLQPPSLLAARWWSGPTLITRNSCCSLTCHSGAGGRLNKSSPSPVGQGPGSSVQGPGRYVNASPPSPTCLPTQHLQVRPHRSAPSPSEIPSGLLLSEGCDIFITLVGISASLGLLP